MLEGFVSAWRSDAQLVQGMPCEILAKDIEFPEFIKVSFDVIMLDTARSGLNYRSEVQSIWVDAEDFAPVCPLTCLLHNDTK